MADQTPPEAVAPKAGGTNKVIVLVAMLVAAAISGGATFALTRPKEEAKGKEAKVAHASKEGKEGEADDEEEAGPEEEGKGEHAVVNLPGFLVNLGDDLNDPHYLKATIAIELDAVGEEAVKGFEGKTAKVRGAVLMYLSGLKLEDVQGVEARKKVLLNLRKEVRQTAGRKLVRDVYLTEMVVQ